MTFLNPAILIGLIAAGIPILIHLFNLRKLKKVEFSTLMFLKELQKNKIRKIVLKQWLLMLIRILIVIFLVLTFSRPAIKGYAIIGTPTLAKTTAVFIVDDTFSMSVADNKGSYLNQSKTLITNLINNLQDQDEAIIIRVSNPNDENNIFTSDKNGLIKRVSEITLSDRSETLNEAVVKAASIIGEAKNFNKELYLFSDFQKSRMTNNEVFSDLGELLNERVRVFIFNFGTATPFNIGVDSLKVNSQIIEIDKPLRLSAFINNYSNRSVDNLVVSMFLNDERIAQKGISLKENENQEVMLESNVKGSGTQRLRIEIEDDEVLNDNQNFVSLKVPEKFSILFLSDNSEETIFVRYALQAADNKGQFQIDEKRLSQIAATNLNNYDLVFLFANEKISSLADIQKFVQNGGGLFIFPNENLNLNYFNSLLQNFDLPIASDKIILQNENKILFDKVDFQHPLFSDLFVSEENRKIESPDIKNYFKINSGGIGFEIISLQDKSSFLSSYNFGKGRILVCAVPPNLTSSNFPLKGIFAPIVYNSIFYLTNFKNLNASIVAGESFNINLQDEVVKIVTVKKPTDDEERIVVDNLSTNIDFTNTDVLGFYFVKGDEEFTEEFVVNHNSKESELIYLNEEAIKEYLTKINFTGNFYFVNKEENVSEVVNSARFGSELWQPFLIIALILALIEMFLSRSTRKDFESLKNS